MLKCIFFNEIIFVLIKISLKFAAKGPIDNKPALVQIKRLGVEQATSLYLNHWWPSFRDAYIFHLASMSYLKEVRWYEYSLAAVLLTLRNGDVFISIEINPQH